LGPIALFDKSFLQSLRLDEAVWFDNYFITNVCPLFYIETLADLEKRGGKGRAAAEEVRIIADKFPQMSSVPCAYHSDLCLASLLGYDVAMTGQIPLAQAKLVMHEGKPSAIAEEASVAAAFLRWQEGRYLEVEQLFAKFWRKTLAELNLGETASLYRSFGIDPKSCNSLEQAKALAQTLTTSTASPPLQIELTLSLLDIDPEYRAPVIERWNESQSLSLQAFSPHAAFVLSVMIFFNIALAAGLISTKRPSNLVDIAYLFYLPFCMVFISSDRLHQIVAPLFLRENQEFVWGIDLKRALGEIDSHFSSLPDIEKEKGLVAFAINPPIGIGQLVTQLWDRHLPGWREPKKPSPQSDDRFKRIIEKVKEFEQAEPAKIDPKRFRVKDVESVTLKRRVSKRRGSWYQIPKGAGED
jgi:hypothetical protein